MPAAALAVAALAAGWVCVSATPKTCTDVDGRQTDFYCTGAGLVYDATAAAQEAIGDRCCTLATCSNSQKYGMGIDFDCAWWGMVYDVSKDAVTSADAATGLATSDCCLNANAIVAGVGPGAGGNAVFIVAGVRTPSLGFTPGSAYAVSHPAVHPLRFSTTPDGTHGGGVEYTAGVTVTGTSATIAVTSSTPNPLYYYCATHAGMGGWATSPTCANTDGSQTNYDCPGDGLVYNAAAGATLITVGGRRLGAAAAAARCCKRATCSNSQTHGTGIDYDCAWWGMAYDASKDAVASANAATGLAALDCCMKVNMIVADVAADAGGNAAYVFFGVRKPSLSFTPGSAYAVSYPAAHALRFSTTPDGTHNPTTHGGGVEYTAGVTVTDTSTTIAVSSSTPNPLYYYCANYEAMGGAVAIRRQPGKLSLEEPQQTPAAADQGATKARLAFVLGVLGVIGVAVGFRAREARGPESHIFADPTEKSPLVASRPEPGVMTAN